MIGLDFAYHKCFRAVPYHLLFFLRRVIMKAKITMTITTSVTVTIAMLQLRIGMIHVIIVACCHEYKVWSSMKNNNSGGRTGRGTSYSKLDDSRNEE